MDNQLNVELHQFIIKTETSISLYSALARTKELAISCILKDAHFQNIEKLNSNLNNCIYITLSEDKFSGLMFESGQFSTLL